jgi:hypothetical protein
MRRRMMPLFAALVVALLSSAGHAAATATVESGVSELTVGGGTISVLDKYSDAYGFAASDIDGTDEHESDGAFWDRSVTAHVDGATATGQTAQYDIGATALATPPSGAAGAYASTLQAVRFQATTAGTLTFDAAYVMSQDLVTSLLGDSAGASTTVGLKLYNSAGMLLDSDSASLDNFLENGASNSWTDSGLLSVSGYFNAGDTGVLKIWADAEALAFTIPVPGALLLAGIGAGLVGWVRRRKAF